MVKLQVQVETYTTKIETMSPTNLYHRGNVRLALAWSKKETKFKIK